MTTRHTSAQHSCLSFPPNTANFYLDLQPCSHASCKCKRGSSQTVLCMESYTTYVLGRSGVRCTHHRYFASHAAACSSHTHLSLVTAVIGLISWACCAAAGAAMHDPTTTHTGHHTSGPVDAGSNCMALITIACASSKPSGLPWGFTPLTELQVGETLLSLRQSTHSTEGTDKLIHTCATESVQHVTKLCCNSACRTDKSCKRAGRQGLFVSHARGKWKMCIRICMLVC